MNLTASADFPTPPSLFSTLKKEKLIVNLNDFHNKCDEQKKKKKVKMKTNPIITTLC